MDLGESLAEETVVDLGGGWGWGGFMASQGMSPSTQMQEGRHRQAY